MKKYLLKRILFSLFSLVIVTGIVMALIYSLMDRKAIFIGDDIHNKRQDNEKILYENNKYQNYGYIEFKNYSIYLSEKYSSLYGEENYQEHDDYFNARDVLKNEDAINQYLNDGVIANIPGLSDVVEFSNSFKKQGYKIQYLAPVYNSRNHTIKSSPYILAIKEKSVFSRIWSYFTNLFKIETIHDVDKSENIERYIRIEWDELSNMPALVGSGTTHKYLIYFDDKFPYIHQNIIHLNLGKSYVVNRGQDIVDVMTSPTGVIKQTQQEYPSQIGSGEFHNISYDFHTVTYNKNPQPLDKEMYLDNYTLASQRKDGLSRMGNSFVIGLIATFLSYLLGLPIGIWMSRRKDKLIDKIGMGYIIFILAVPSLAYIFMFAAIGYNVFHLPYKFATAQVKVLAYILPVVSLALPSVASLMKWMRRYMIDQMNSDYVKFARSQGLSEGEIFNKHIFKNALIYLIHGIPGAILGCLTGAIITERVYSVPGIGNLLTDAINKYDNSVIVGATVFYTTLSIVSLILGDLLLAKYDPRISFTDGG